MVTFLSSQISSAENMLLYFFFFTKYNYLAIKHLQVWLIEWLGFSYQNIFSLEKNSALSLNFLST